MISQRIFLTTVIIAALVLPAFADSDRSEDLSRIQHSTDVLNEIMRTPDEGIPQDLLQSAKCMAIIPGEEKAAFFLGERYGKGVAVCRTARGWSAPLFLTIGGGSFGFQWGGSETDVVMLFMNDHALQSLLSDHFKLGADATVAAGPVGRHTSAGTDLRLKAEILTYSRSRGIFAGISLDGAVIRADHSGDRAMYGANVERSQILDGHVPVPNAAEPLLSDIERYARTSA